MQLRAFKNLSFKIQVMELRQENKGLVDTYWSGRTRWAPNFSGLMV
jgi:hypothetical protein